MCRAPGPEPVAVIGKPRIPTSLQHLKYRLLDPSIQDSWHSEFSHSAVRLGYFYPSDRSRPIGPTQKLGANLGPVLPKVSRQILNAHRVDTRTTFVGLDSPQCVSTILLFADLLHHPFSLGRAF